MTINGNTAAEVTPPSPSFRLKGGLFPLTQLELAHYDYSTFAQDLKNKVAEAPAFFQQTPVVLSLECLAPSDAPELEQSSAALDAICQLCREHGLIPVALRGGSDVLQQQALDLGMALMPVNRPKARAGRSLPGSEASQTRHTESSFGQAVPEQACLPLGTSTADTGVTASQNNGIKQEKASETPAETRAEPIHRASKIITTPVRSGQQVYAPGGDLIVMAQVSAGAEILADGNIHVYGPLRGRALAGVKGDSRARVFCHSLEAELISIAGTFKLDEDLRSDHWKQPVQIHLNEMDLFIEPLIPGSHR